MQYHVKLIQSEEGWAVSCPALPGCHSQGATREEALANIRDAIQEWLAVETPQWHLNELAATEARVNSGEETFLEWEAVKAQRHLSA